MSGIFSPDAWNKVWTYKATFALGLWNTVQTSIFGILLALILGLIFGLMATCGNKVLKAIARVYVEIIQNTPVQSHHFHLTINIISAKILFFTPKALNYSFS